MSISLPTYVRRRTPLLGRAARVRAIVTTGWRREFRRAASVVAIAAGILITTLQAIVLVLFAPFLLPGVPLDLRFFVRPASDPTILFFVTLMAAVVGGGLIADDRRSMALTLYLSRPITSLDYLGAKAAILGALVSMISILPLVITALVAGLLGLFPWDIALPALGLSVAVGALLTAFYTAFALFLSSLTPRRGYAAAGIFALTFGLTVPAQLLSDATGNGSVLYASPWQNYLAVARAAFGAPAGSIDWAPALGILLVITAVAFLVTYVRMRTAEVVAG